MPTYIYTKFYLYEFYNNLHDRYLELGEGRDK